MAWVRLDDGFPEHWKAEAAGDHACWMYVSGLTYCARALSNGFIPQGRVPKLTGLRQPMRLAAKLVEVGLWEAIEGGFRVHDYLDYQPSAEKIEEQRQQKTKRMADYREKRKGGPPVDPDVDPST